MYRLALLGLVTAATLAAGCAGGFGYSASVSNAGYGPDLVYAAPGVQVIADYDEPIFFADSFYWRYDGRTWYRSTQYTGGWAYATPPPAVLRIERPREYIHYRPQGWAPRHTPARQQPVVRDHRETGPSREAPPKREQPPAPKDQGRPKEKDRHDERDRHN